MVARAYTDVSHELLRRVEDCRYAVGSRLPSERDLAEDLGVSRPTVREALAALELAGIIETHVGAGSYVARRSGNLVASLTDASPVEIIAARVVLEPQLARAAARWHDRDSLAAIARPLRALDRLVASGDSAHPASADRRFHAAIAHASGNTVLEAVAAPIWELMEQALWNRIKEREWTSERSRRVAGEHRRIFEAIRARDPDLAAFEMERHLRAVQSELFAEDADALPRRTPSAPPAPHSRSAQKIR
jgi:DNA-binding FadR family transcriptional regulator